MVFLRPWSEPLLKAFPSSETEVGLVLFFQSEMWEFQGGCVYPVFVKRGWKHPNVYQHCWCTKSVSFQPDKDVTKKCPKKESERPTPPASVLLRQVESDWKGSEKNFAEVRGASSKATFSKWASDFLEVQRARNPPECAQPRLSGAR